MYRKDRERPWTLQEDFELKNGLKVFNITDVAKKLGRDVEDARRRAKELGLVPRED